MCTEMIKKIMRISLLSILALIVLYSIASVTVNKIALSAIEQGDMKKLKAVSSLPFIKPEGIPASDFLDCFFDRVPGNYPLEYACRKGDTRAAEVMLAAGVDPNSRHLFNINDGMCLDIAISHCDTDLAELLLRYGGTLSHIYRSLSYALHNHGVEGLKEMYELLDRSHALSEDKNGEMIKMAARMSDKEAVEYLVSTLDLKPTWTGSDGKTLLHLCAASGFESEDKKVEFATFLIANGVSRSACDDQGKTAYDYAVERDLGSLAEILKP